MNFIERQVKLNRDLFEIGTKTVSELFSIERQAWQSYFSETSSLVKKMTGTRDFNEIVAAQREFGQTQWGKVRELMQQRGSVLRDAVEQTGKLYRAVLTPQATDVEIEGTAKTA